MVRQESHIQDGCRKEEKEYQIDMHLKKNRSKGIAINKVPIKKASELFGILNIVFLFAGRSEYYQKWSGGAQKIY